MSHYCANDTFEPQFDMSLPGPNQTLYQIIELFKLSNYIDKDAVSDDLEYHSRDVTKILRACRIFWKWNAWGGGDGRSTPLTLECCRTPNFKFCPFRPPTDSIP